MRQDIDQFTARNAAILIVGPDGPNAFRVYWQENGMPFPGLADLRSRVADRYAQEVNLLKLGRMPAIFIVDQDGMIRFTHYSDNMRDYPTNEQLLEVLDMLNAEG